MDIANIEAVAKLNARRGRLLELLDVAENGQPVISLALLETRWRAEGSREIKPGSDLPAEALQNSIICIAEDELLHVDADLSRLGVSTPKRKTFSDALPPDADLSTAMRAARGWRDLANMMIRAWMREIGPRRPESHFIDEFAGSIKDLRERADALKPLLNAAEKYRDTICLVNNTKPDDAVPGSSLAVINSRIDAARKVLP